MAESQKKVSFSLGERDRAFIQSQVDQGRFRNKTEVILAGLRLLEYDENQQKLQHLRTEITKGDADIKNGKLTEYERDDTLLKDILED